MPNQIAASFERSQNSVGKFVWLSRTYLVMCDADENGQAIIPARATSAKQYTWMQDNSRATKRFGAQCQLMQKLADEINNGKMDFKTASKIVQLVDAANLHELINNKNFLKAAVACSKNKNLNLLDEMEEMSEAKFKLRFQLADRVTGCFGELYKSEDGARKALDVHVRGRISGEMEAMKVEDSKSWPADEDMRLTESRERVLRTMAISRIRESFSIEKVKVTKNRVHEDCAMSM